MGADGAMWFTNTNNRLGRITTDGAITPYDATDDHVTGTFGITTGADGNVWFTSVSNHRIGFIRP